ncbi:hypothetical protein GCM10010124_25220 [Pilimelia terevasa]|uniref:Uncharacterized protein n=1 Tax=Pilimelia terevasa TaxID=53372 RepID=A0A8J3BUZ3_9ACTN|nr:hypothetical protein [Pilimelia terevasa]GGK31419.1 hypothetical protein GCM10010124_25220 [Pilimelia terevasa]
MPNLKRHVYTAAELAAIVEAINTAGDGGRLMRGAMEAIWKPLLTQYATGSGQNAAVRPAEHEIPLAQWQAVTEAILARADQWGLAPVIAFDLAIGLPSHYPDPTVPTPDLPVRVNLPGVHHLEADRDATEVISAASAYCDALAAAYGPGSRYHLDAVVSWQRQLSRMFQLTLGARTRVHRDGPLSLLVHTEAGITYGLLFHTIPRRCITCDAGITDDGTAIGGEFGCSHAPTYPLDRPQPGTWSFHS